MGGGISKMANQELLATIRDRYRASSRKEKSVNGGEKMYRVGGLIVGLRLS